MKAGCFFRGSGVYTTKVDLDGSTGIPLSDLTLTEKKPPIPGSPKTGYYPTEDSDLAPAGKRTVLVTLREAETDILNRAPFYRHTEEELAEGRAQRFPAHVVLWDVDGTLGETEHHHMKAFRRAVSELAGFEISDRAWDFFEQKCFKIAEHEACWEVIRKAIYGGQFLERCGDDPDFCSEMIRISEGFISAGHHFEGIDFDPAIRLDEKISITSLPEEVHEPVMERIRGFQNLKIAKTRKVAEDEGIPLVKGALSTLLFYCSHGTVCVAGTGSPYELGKRTIQTLGLSELIPFIVADSHYREGKPASDCFDESLKLARQAMWNDHERMWPLPRTRDLVVHVLDNSEKGTHGGLKACGSRGTCFHVNPEFPVSASKLMEYHGTHPVPAIRPVNPVVSIPDPRSDEERKNAVPGIGPGFGALRDKLIELFGFSQEKFLRTVPLKDESGEYAGVERAMVTGQQWYDLWLEYGYSQLCDYWKGLEPKVEAQMKKEAGRESITPEELHEEMRRRGFNLTKDEI